MKKKILTIAILALCTNAMAITFDFGTKTNPKGDVLEIDSKSFIYNGKRILPVMGEMHYARVPASEWRREIKKMKAGGITIVATYCFWIHHEPIEGHWDWSGNRDLHSFLKICKEEEMPVVLRIGPFCHGEVYQGGFPTWIVEKSIDNPKEYKLRSLAKGFMASVQRLYSNIYAQASDMLWKHGGPIVGIQIENECRGPWRYLTSLKDMAVSIGFDTPFYTRTGWPKLNDKEEFGKFLPLYGDYADGFWDRSLKDMPGEYAKAFTMKDTRISSVIATETFGNNQNTMMDVEEYKYPYLTCELGGGMMQSYHRRINMSGKEAMPLAICKLGSGSNLPGYYMYHGGTNPYNAKQTMAETQNSATTNYNDMPVMSYDFQCPLGEMGQPESIAFNETRLLHMFLADWGNELASMDVDTISEHYARRGCFEFYNTYVRILNENGVSYVRPVNMKWRGHTITADAQLLCHVADTIYFIAIKGKKPVIYVDGKKYKPKFDKPLKTKDLTLHLMSDKMAHKAYKIDGVLHFANNDGGILYKEGESIMEEYWTERGDVTYKQLRVAETPRKVIMGARKVAAMPNDADFAKAAVYEIQYPSMNKIEAEYSFLKINYAGDCARVYADGKLIQDNFWNGKPMLVRMSDVIGKRVEVRILPLKKDAPIYLQKTQKELLNAAENGILLQMNGIKIVQSVRQRL